MACLSGEPYLDHKTLLQSLSDSDKKHQANLAKKRIVHIF